MRNNKRKSKSIEYLIKNYSIKSKSEIIQDLGYTWSYIQKLCCLNNIKRDHNESRNYGKYSILTDLNNPISCYWIGFIMADGHIYKNRNIQINLSTTDEGHISKIKNHIGEVKMFISKTNIRVTISDVETCRFLTNKFSWKSNKTKNPVVIPEMTEDCLFSMIIGFIDGDGSINKRGLIKVKCDRSWKSLLDRFYRHLTGEEKYFSIQKDGCSIFYITKLKTIFEIKRKAIELGLPIMIRKWDKVNERNIKCDKKEIVSDLMSNGKTVKEIKEITKFSNSLIYNVFAKRKPYFRSGELAECTITAVDIHRDGIYRISFREIVLKNLSENKFDYAQQKVSSKEFTMTFHFNFYDIEFLLDKSKVLELGTIPTIIQKI